MFTKKALLFLLTMVLLGSVVACSSAASTPNLNATIQSGVATVTVQAKENATLAAEVTVKIAKAETLEAASEATPEPEEENQPPRTLDDVIEVGPEDMMNETNVLENDSDPDGDVILVVWAGKPEKGTLGWAQNGTFKFYTDGKFKSGGELKVPFVVADEHGERVTETLKIEVAPRITTTAKLTTTLATSDTVASSAVTPTVVLTPTTGLTPTDELTTSLTANVVVTDTALPTETVVTTSVSVRFDSAPQEGEVGIQIKHENDEALAMLILAVSRQAFIEGNVRVDVSAHQLPSCGIVKPGETGKIKVLRGEDNPLLVGAILPDCSTEAIAALLTAKAASIEGEPNRRVPDASDFFVIKPLRDLDTEIWRSVEVPIK